MSGSYNLDDLGRSRSDLCDIPVVRNSLPLGTERAEEASPVNVVLFAARSDMSHLRARPHDKASMIGSRSAGMPRESELRE